MCVLDLQAAIKGMKEGLVRKDEGDPLLRPAPGATPRARVLKAKVMRESAPSSVRGAVLKGAEKSQVESA